MNRLVFLSAIFLVCSCNQLKKVDNEQRKLLPPNIIFILADDLGWTQLGCYGSEYYQTPNIDKLAAKGMKFTNAYAAAAVCSPTRASIMTGKYPARLKLTDFIPGNAAADHTLLEPLWQKFLPLEEITVAEALKPKGYTTALFGKWHLSKEKTSPESDAFNPDKQGFDEFFITYKPKNGEKKEDAHNVKAITSRSLSFIEKNAEKPFLLFVSHNSIHDPLTESSETIAKYEKKAGAGEEKNNPTIGAVIEILDNSVGQIVQKVEELGLEEHTMIVFFSDNGGKEAHASQAPLRAGKGWLYEGGIREPLIVRWDKNIEAGSTSEAQVISTDFFPTLLNVAGQDSIQVENLDGEDMLPVLQNTGSISRKSLYWHYPHYHEGSGMRPAGALRKGDYKLIFWYEKYITGANDQVELYNLKNDIGEEHDLAAEMPEKAKELKDEFSKWRRNIGAQLPGIHPNYSTQ
ncbi:sulfatase [Flammeovirgaceae bacterium SG7u.111]|nr:sulfatase [Flammeovirgaceae bacterium SG7u.132]WPO35281.1 sulfatase [Flammeovirgaceae bacterium SG7u.111]